MIVEETRVTLGPWDSHFKNLVSSMGQLQNTDVYSDVLFHCKDNKTVKANKFLLSLSSPFMNQIFTKHTDIYAGDVYNILIPDFDSAALQKVVNLVQTGVTNLHMGEKFVNSQTVKICLILGITNSALELSPNKSANKPKMGQESTDTSTDDESTDTSTDDESTDTSTDDESTFKENQSKKKRSEPSLGDSIDEDTNYMDNQNLKDKSISNVKESAFESFSNGNESASESISNDNGDALESILNENGSAFESISIDKESAFEFKSNNIESISNDNESAFESVSNDNESAYESILPDDQTTTASSSVTKLVKMMVDPFELKDHVETHVIKRDNTHDLTIENSNVENGLQCQLCNHTLSSIGNLLRHYGTQHFAEKLKEKYGKLDGECGICNMIFPKEDFLRSHLVNKHRCIEEFIPCSSVFLAKKRKKKIGQNCNVENALQCQLCNHTLSNISNLLRHYGTKHFAEKLKEKYGKLDGECGICNMIFPKEELLRSHLVKKHRCIEEFFPGSSVFSAKKRQNSNVENGLQCQLCNRTLSSMGHLFRHYRTKHFAEKFKEKYGKLDGECGICNMIFPTENLLRSHLVNKHRCIEEFIPVYSSVFSAKKRKKKTAQDTAKIAIQFPCEFCAKSYNDHSKLVSHLALCHFFDKLLENNGDDDCCSICSKTFKNKQYLPIHLAWSHKALANLMDEKIYSL